MVVYRYPAPANQDDFADFCVRLFEKIFGGKFQRYGKSGDKQYGIDVYDSAHSLPLRAAQCKCHELHKYCPPREIQDEVEKASSWEFDLDEFYILTTGKKSRIADDAILKLNRDRPFKQRFVTLVWTWEDIERKLAELDLHSRNFVLHPSGDGSMTTYDAMLSRLLPTIADKIACTSSNGQLQKKFELIELHIKNGDQMLCKYELDQINQMPIALQTAKDRYLTHRLNAKYFMLIGQYDQAARKFLKAFDEQPELDQAMINRAVALELLGQKDEAWKQAEQLLKRGIRTEPLPAIAYRTAPKPHAESTTAYYKAQMSTSEDLNIVIANEARVDGRFEDSIAACDRVLQINPSSARAFLLRALAYHSSAVQGDRNLRHERLELAERDYESARDNASDRLPDDLRADLFRNLANVQFLLGRPDHTASFEEAIRVAKDKLPYVEQYLGYLCARNDFETAGKILKQHGIDDTQRNHRFLKLVIEKNLSETTDSARFIEGMLALYREGAFDRRDECLGFVVQWSIDSGRANEAITRLNAIKDIVDPFEFLCCMAWLEHIEKHEIEAKKSASDAKSLVTPDSPQNYVYLLGRLFVELEDDESALPVLEQAADLSRLTQETRSLLDCAQRLQKHDKILEVCRTLRTNKADCKQSRSLELQILYEYVPKEAKELIHELVQEHPDDRQLYAWLCHIETRLHGQFNALDLNRLPVASETTVSDSQRVIGSLLGAGKFGEAIRYAYEILRCNQGDEIAHGRYMWIFMQNARKSDLHLDYTEVAAECAVLYRENDGETQSVIITSDQAGNRFDGEISADSKLGKELIHRKVGDEVKLSPQSLQPRVVKIEAVLSKYVYRYQQVLQNFQLNFPHANTIQMLKVMDGEELDVSLFKKSLEERRKNIDAVLDLFKQNPLPISALATWLGIEYREAFEFLATKPEIGIRCTLTDATKPYSTAAKEVDLKDKIIVLDQSALLTIENLHLWNFLKNFQLVVMRSVADVFGSHVEELTEDRSKGTMGLTEDGQLYLHELTQSEQQKRISKERSLMDSINKHCQTKESLASASVNQELRDAFGNIRAFPSLDSIAYAHRDPQFLFWTDEMFIQAVARNDFNLEAIGIQDVLQHLRTTGLISKDELFSFNAQLLGWHYNPLNWNVNVAFAAAKLSNWDATSWPFTGVIHQLNSKHWKLDEKCCMALGLFIKVFCSSANNFEETHLLLRVMDAIGERKAADLIRSDAVVACGTKKAMLDSILLSLKIWEERWLGE